MRRKNARAARQTAKPLDIGLHAGPTTPYDPLPEADAWQLIEASFELLRDVGVGFEAEAHIMQLFRDAGCTVAADGLVKFKRNLVEDALGSVAKSVRLWNRSGDSFIEIDNRHTWFVNGMTAIKTIDIHSGERRASTREDLVNLTRIADALPNIDMVTIACKNVERADIFGEADEFRVLVENTTKPLEYLCEKVDSLSAVIEMARAVRGGRKALMEKPYFMQLVTPLPLYYARDHTDQIITALEAGVPLTMGTVTIGGASAPITMAGCLVHCLATDLAGMVFAQLLHKGAFCIGGSDPAFMEPATGGRGGTTQLSLSDMVLCQVCRMLGIPSMTGIGGRARAPRFNQDAIFEISSNMMQTFYSRPANCDYLGLMDDGLTYSPHALLYGNEMAGMIRRMWQGVPVDEGVIAMALTLEEGPRGNYLAQRHTAEYCRSEMWNSQYFGANQPVSMSTLPDLELFERINTDLLDILSTHCPEPLSEGIAAEIQSIQATFEQTC